MSNKELLEEFCGLEDKFKAIEAESEILRQANEGEYLCIRLDGIGLSKKYLKDSLSDNQFKGKMWSALEHTFDVLKRKAPTNAQNIFLGAMICSDESSIILNSQKNYYNGRLFKLTTTIASTFTCFFNSSNSKKKKKTKTIGGAFDARPLVLSSVEEASKYLAYRYAIYIRNTASKLLRIEGVPDCELYAQENQNSLTYYFSKIEQLQLNKKFLDIAKEAMFFIPNPEGELVVHKYKSLQGFLDNFPNELTTFDEWLDAKCR